MEAQQVITTLLERLKPIPGIAGLVLGGSRARGVHTESSDIDIGIYYQPESSIDLDALEAASQQLDDEHRAGLITPIGEWGPWINGGGWLTVGGHKVDLLYRDSDKVSSVIEDCRNGQLSIQYQPGHPHGFCSSIYMGEVFICKPLWGPKGLIGEWKALTTPYPAALKTATLTRFLWEAGFSIQNASKAVHRGDISYVAGHLFRTISCMTQVLFAINETYLVNEKGAVALCDRFLHAPRDFAGRVAGVYNGLSAKDTDLHAAIEQLGGLLDETEILAKEYG